MTAGSITLRCATGRDFDAIDAMLARSCYKLLKNDYPPSVMVTAVPLISRANPALVRSGTYYVAETSDGQIIGAGGWIRRPRRATWPRCGTSWSTGATSGRASDGG
jgi:hypothetical protein